MTTKYLMMTTPLNPFLLHPDLPVVVVEGECIDTHGTAGLACITLHLLHRIERKLLCCFLLFASHFNARFYCDFFSPQKARSRCYATTPSYIANSSKSISSPWLLNPLLCTTPTRAAVQPDTFVPIVPHCSRASPNTTFFWIESICISSIR